MRLSLLNVIFAAKLTQYQVTGNFVSKCDPKYTNSNCLGQVPRQTLSSTSCKISNVCLKCDPGLTWVVSSLRNSCYLRTTYWPRASLFSLTWVGGFFMELKLFTRATLFSLFGWWVPYGTHVIYGQHIELVLDYFFLLGWWVPHGPHFNWGQHINLVLDYWVLLAWRVPYGTHVIDPVVNYSV